ncbi:hypothetical protein HHL17_12865 [Chitinophaga sp. G-6-1-13]|uniref:Uncharacterized protein n=1 Tax=Chitinophaga fulva TaxID=2728842 RepID=A0A848GL19_9BACT|nr:hypothetical protein [Chitinophaga fulva]NML38089.1 hypothetical protein [Chitinophaga fulva]
MKVIRHNDIVNIIPEEGEEITIHRETVYPNRIIVFKRLPEKGWQEIHFDKNKGTLISREEREQTLPVFRYHFDDAGIKAEVQHIFQDTAHFNGYTVEDEDAETIRIKLFRDGKELSHGIRVERINARPHNYFEEMRRDVDSLLQQEESNRKFDLFLQETYTHWTMEEKVHYHYGRILFEDRMQGGYPSGYTSPAAHYFSKWFMNTFEPYNIDSIGTLQAIAKRFDLHIEETLLREMVRHELRSDEWRTIARQLGLLDK